LRCIRHAPRSPFFRAVHEVLSLPRSLPLLCETAPRENSEPTPCKNNPQPSNCRYRQSLSPLFYKKVFFWNNHLRPARHLMHSIHVPPRVSNKFNPLVHLADEEAICMSRRIPGNFSPGKKAPIATVFSFSLPALLSLPRLARLHNHDSIHPGWFVLPVKNTDSHAELIPPNATGPPPVEATPTRVTSDLASTVSWPPVGDLTVDVLRIAGARPGFRQVFLVREDQARRQARLLSPWRGGGRRASGASSPRSFPIRAARSLLLDAPFLVSS